MFYHRQQGDDVHVLVYFKCQNTTNIITLNVEGLSNAIKRSKVIEKGKKEEQDIVF